MRYLFVEADELGQWLRPHGPHERWQDHGMGLLLTIAEQHGYHFDVLSLKAMHSWAEVRLRLRGYDVLAMNVRSWRYIYAKRTAELFKAVNPGGQVWVGGMHATVAPDEMASVEAFDVIIRKDAPGTWLELLQSGGSTERIVEGQLGPFARMDDLPWINRELWPRTPEPNVWPLEGPGGWGPGPRAATMLTGFRCPMHCSFCYPAEQNHFGPLRRRSVGHVLGELKDIDRRWGPVTTVVFHDSEFLMNPGWLGEFAERYPREFARPFWASCRADFMAKWPDLFRTLVRDANWHTVSIGLESGNQQVLDIMNKETTVAQNLEAIDIINRLGDELVAQGKRPPVIFANVMFAVPGETPEAAFDTVRMLGRIKRCLPSMSWYTPYPGNTLGDKMIAEGRSLDNHKKYLRFPNEAKMTGIDYQFYADLWGGKYDHVHGVDMARLVAGQGVATEALV